MVQTKGRSPTRPAPRESRRERLLACVALVALVGFCFGRVAGHRFLLWDDDSAVTNNPFLAPPSAQSLLRFWSAPLGGLYIPLSHTFFWLETWVATWLHGQWTLDPRVYHVGLVCLHAACALLVFQILARLVREPWAAALGAALFAVHPLQAESVAWVTETRGVLAALLALLSIERWLAADDASPGRARRVGRSLATLAFVLALLAKPSAIVAPLIVLALSAGFSGRPLRAVAPPLALWLAIALAAIVITKSEQPGGSLRYEAPLWARPFVAFDALAFYLEKLVWPVDLCADYGRQPVWLIERPILWWHWVVPVGLACGLAALPDRGPGRRRWLSAGGVLLAGFLPVLGLVPFHFQDISTVADRYAYLALLGPALALAAALERWRSPRVWTIALGALALLGILAWRQAGIWRDTETLFAHTLGINPRSHIAHINLGALAALRGQTAEAEAHYRAAIEVDPRYPVAHDNLARLHVQQGRFDDAIAGFHAAIEADPAYPHARTNLGKVLAQLGRSAEAESVLRDAVRADPTNWAAHLTLGRLLVIGGRPAEAVAPLERVIALLGRSPEADAALAEAYTRLGKHELAEKHRRNASATFR